MVSPDEHNPTNPDPDAAAPQRRAFRVGEPALLGLVAVFASMIAAYALIKHAHFRTGLDLSIFDQAIWHYSRFEAPASSITGQSNLLGDHFHPILVLIAPLYWVWSDPRVLLIVQALLVAASAIPVFAFARPRLGRLGALMLAAGYLSFWGLMTGTGFEFHEVAFAPLLIALAIWAIDLRRWWVFVAVVVLLVTVKEDMGLFVAFLGIYLLSLGEIRASALTLLAGVACYQLVTKVVIPYFAVSGHFSYWTYGALGKDLPDALVRTASHPWRPFHIALANDEIRQTLTYLILPFIGLTFASRIAILALPLLAERFFSTSPQFWGTHYHYSLAIAPVLAMGAAAGLQNIAHLIAPRRVRAITTTGAAAVLVVSVLTSVVFIPADPKAEVTNPNFFRDPEHISSMRRALERIPPHASVTTVERGLAHLAHRQTVRQLDPHVPLTTTYLLANVVYPVGPPGPAGGYRAQQADLARRLAPYYVVYYDDGWIVARQRPKGPAGARPSDLALTPIAKPQAERLLRLYFPWEQARSQVAPALGRCLVMRSRGDRAAACSAAAGRAFRSRQRAAVSVLRNVAPTLQGGCRQLANLSVAGMTAAARDFELLRTAVASGTPHELKRAAAKFGEDTEAFDLPGRFARFLLLCYPA